MNKDEWRIVNDRQFQKANEEHSIAQLRAKGYSVEKVSNNITEQELLDLYEATPKAKALHKLEAEEDSTRTEWINAATALEFAGLAARQTPEWIAYITAHLSGRTYGGTND